MSPFGPNGCGHSQISGTYLPEANILWTFWRGQNSSENTDTFWCEPNVMDLMLSGRFRQDHISANQHGISSDILGNRKHTKARYYIHGCQTKLKKLSFPYPIHIET